MNELTVQNNYGVTVPMATLNITWAGSNGDLSDPVSYDLDDASLLTIATEVVRNGGVPGIAADPNASFDGFVIDRFPATADLPLNRLMLRPKTPFGF